MEYSKYLNFSDVTVSIVTEDPCNLCRLYKDIKLLVVVYFVEITDEKISKFALTLVDYVHFSKYAGCFSLKKKENKKRKCMMLCLKG